MKIDDFLVFLDINDVEYSTNDQSVIMSEAPCCGGHRKIYFFKDETFGKPLFGKCMKCDTSWNSWSYLSELGFEKNAIDVLHGTTDLANVELGVTAGFNFDLSRQEGKRAPIQAQSTFDVSGYYKIPEIPDHEASKYAIRRGWAPAFVEDIVIDIFANAVVFICREEGVIVGYQQRYLIPPFPHMKVKSAVGFKKTQHVMEFPNSGDLLVCEGPFTALSAWHYGYHGICTFGAGVSERQIQLIAGLARKTGKGVGVAFDLDKAGKKGYRTLRLGLHWHGIPAYRVRPEHGNDLNDSWMAGKGVKIIPPDQDDITVPELEIPEEGVYE